MPVLRGAELEQKLSEIISRFQKAFSPVAIYLLGSYAYGTPGPHSDLDFLVVVEDSPLGAYERDAVAYRALGDIRVPIDVQVYTRPEFEERAALPVSFERTVLRKGKQLYGA